MNPLPLIWDFLFDADRATQDRVIAAARKLITVTEAKMVQRLTEEAQK